MNPLSITIVGGGIGGLTAALALAQEGHQIRLFEQSTQFADIGAGIQLSPNCNRVLYQLGLSKQLAARAFLPTGIETRHWQNGKTINEIALGDACTQKYGFPYINIHRADLISILAEAVTRQENIEVHLSSRVLHLDQGSAQVNITISNTSAQQQQFNADLLIGADGIHSMVRKAVVGEVELRFSGYFGASAVVPFVNCVSPVTSAEVNARFTPVRTASKFAFIASASATEPLVKVFGTETVCASATGA